MDKKKLDLHITDIAKKIDLKIYEQPLADTTLFSFEFEDLNNKNNSNMTIYMDESHAALLFEGLNNIFEEDDKEYLTDEDNKKEISDTEIFFKILKQCSDLYTEDDEDDEDNEGFTF